MQGLKQAKSCVNHLLKNEEQIKHPTHSSAKQAPLLATKQPIPTTPYIKKAGSAQTQMNDVVATIFQVK